MTDHPTPEAGHGDHVRALFEVKAATWTAKYAPGGQLADRVPLFATALSANAAAGGHVLDLGCGTGELARALAIAGWLVTGCDISEQMLQRAAARDEAGSVRWVSLAPDWRVLPFGPASFDVIVAASVLEYVHIPAEVLRECGRVLRPGGVVLCTVPDPSHPVRWLEWLAAACGRLPRAAAAAGCWPRLGGYLVYLRLSRHRHLPKWWHTTAVQVGLCPASSSFSRFRRSAGAPLRLYTFRKFAESGGQAR